jgi:hypothetical protein
MSDIPNDDKPGFRGRGAGALLCLLFPHPFEVCWECHSPSREVIATRSTLYSLAQKGTTRWPSRCRQWT